MSSPPIEPVASQDRPRFSIMLPAWNAGKYLGSTLESVLDAHPPEGTQIEVIDDGSTDDTAGVAATFANRGVGYHLNETQRGASANFNVCIRRARGHLVHLLHADDQVMPGFYEAAERAFDRADVMASFTRAVYIDEEGGALTTTRSEGPSGVWGDAVRVLAVSNRIRPPAVVVRRAAYEEVGGFREDLHHAADWEMWMRLARHGPIWFEDEPLALYRVHRGQDTTNQVSKAANITERVVALEMITADLPGQLARRSMRRGLLYSSVFAGRTAARLARQGEWRSALAQTIAAGRCAIAGVIASPSLALRGSPAAHRVPDR